MTNRNVYRVRNIHGEGKDTMVSAPNRARAINYVARTTLEAKVLKAAEAIALLKSGVPIADCDDNPQLELPIPEDDGVSV